MYDTKHDKCVKTPPFIVVGWNSAYSDAYFLSLVYIITDNLANLKNSKKMVKTRVFHFKILLVIFLKIGQKPTIHGMRNKNKTCNSLTFIYTYIP